MESKWPVVDGSYTVGDRDAPVAVCTLTSEKLAGPLATTSGVAIAGQVFTANLGIERIVTNVTANPAIRFLVLCGKDSKIFRPGQSLSALADNGIDAGHRIVGAEGYDPVLPSLTPIRIEAFRRQIELVDWTGEEDLDTLLAQITALADRSPGQFAEELIETDEQPSEPVRQERFVSLSPGGKREPLQYDPKGYFVITLDRPEEQIVLRHYLPDHSAAHEMRGRVAASMFLGLVREGLVTQLSHAGYLGEELAKAEAALRLDLRYDQDRPLKRIVRTVDPQASPAATEAPAQAPSMPRIQPPLSLNQLTATSEGEKVNITLAVTDPLSDGTFDGTFLEPDEKDPFSSFGRTEHPLTISTTEDTKAIMGTMSEVVAGATVRVSGVLQTEGRIDAQAVVILTSVATVH